MSQYQVVAKTMSEAMSLARERYGDEVCIVDTQVTGLGVELTVIEQPLPERPSQPTMVEQSINEPIEVDAIAQLRNEIQALSSVVKRSAHRPMANYGGPERLAGVPNSLLAYLGEFTELRYSEVFKRIDQQLAAPLRFNHADLHLWFVEGESQFSVIAKYATMALRASVKVELTNLELEPHQAQLLQQLMHHGEINQRFKGTLRLSAGTNPVTEGAQYVVVPATHSPRALDWALADNQVDGMIIAPMHQYCAIGDLLAVAAQHQCKVVGLSSQQGLSLPILPLASKHYGARWLKTLSNSRQEASA